MPLPEARVREEWASLNAHTDVGCCHLNGNHLRSAGAATARRLDQHNTGPEYRPVPGETLICDNGALTWS